MLAWTTFGTMPLNVLGGTLYTFPPMIQLLDTSDAAGISSLSVVWPAGTSSGLDIYLQFLVQDTSVAADLTLSNAVQTVTP